MHKTAICIAGFGDNASMFEPLARTQLAEACRLELLNLPGFGAGDALRPTTLQALGDRVAAKAGEAGATVVIAHSVASIIASLAAREPTGPIDTVISLEGNLTAADAYFSGTAANYPDPQAFRSSFMAKLQRKSDPLLVRYCTVVAEADALALWQLGCDAKRFSEETVPGEVLMQARAAAYLYNPANCPPETLEWLERHPLPRYRLDGASHWPTLDQPDETARAILHALSGS